MDRKADLGFLLRLILILIGAVILIFVIGQAWLSKTGEAAELEKCRNTALIIDKGRDITTTQITELDCSMRDIRVDYSNVLVRGKVSDRLIFRPVAETMRDCWYVMGEGNFKPFYQKMIGSATSPCVVCAKIRFDPKIAKEYKKELPGFDIFLNETMLGSNKTYYEYMNFEQYSRSFTIIPIILYWLSKEQSLQSTGTLDLTSDYYVVYNVVLNRALLSSESKISRFFNEHLFSREWAQSGADDLTMIYLVESENLGTVSCDYIANEMKEVRD